MILASKPTQNSALMVHMRVMARYEMIFLADYRCCSVDTDATVCPLAVHGLCNGREIPGGLRHGDDARAEWYAYYSYPEILRKKPVRTMIWRLATLSVGSSALLKST